MEPIRMPTTSVRLRKRIAFLRSGVMSVAIYVFVQVKREQVVFIRSRRGLRRYSFLVAHYGGKVQLLRGPEVYRKQQHYKSKRCELIAFEEDHDLSVDTDFHRLKSFDDLLS